MIFLPRRTAPFHYHHTLHREAHKHPKRDGVQQKSHQRFTIRTAKETVDGDREKEGKGQEVHHPPDLHGDVFAQVGGEN